MKLTFIYPNQLFYNHPGLRKDRKIILVQDPLFFGDHRYPLIFHKQKILLHLASMDNYKNELAQRGYSVSIYKYSDLKTKDYNRVMLKKLDASEIYLAELVDYTLEKRLCLVAKSLGVKIRWFDSPGFILNGPDIENDFKNKKKHLMNSFYIKQRKRLNILIDEDQNPVGGKWSFDFENRKKLPKDIIIPPIPQIQYKADELQASVQVINKNFKNNLGTIEHFNYPISRDQAKISFANFLEKRFKSFGPYEDSISSEENYIFHSVITPYLNIGLLTPKEILDETIDYAKEFSIPLNSLEGFIRQIVGWREFIRGIYVADGVKQRNSNFWGFKRKIPESFYKGNTGLEPLDNSIKRCLKFGYTHHIERLMVLGNIMILSGIHPKSVYNWFMELFIDSYDWVMVPNIYGMSQFADGGLMSTKPYISGSNYILKMSNYKKGVWSETWDALYWNFIHTHRSFFSKNPRMSMMVSLYDKQDIEKKKKNIKLTQNFLTSFKV